MIFDSDGASDHRDSISINQYNCVVSAKLGDLPLAAQYSWSLLDFKKMYLMNYLE